MRKYPFLFLALFFIITATPMVFAAGEDFQYWKQESASWKISQDWKLGISEEVYFKDNASDFYHQHTELGATYTGLAKELEVGVNFRHTIAESKSVWTREEQPSVHGTFKWSGAGCRFSDRNRFEYRIRENADDIWVYRNQLTVFFPWQVPRFKIQPFWADEFFVDFDEGDVTENRMLGGLSFSFSEAVGMDVYYMWRRKESSSVWSGDNIFGTRLKFSF